MKKLPVLFFLCAYFTGICLFAQPRQIRFQHLNIHNGLSQSQVNDILQDQTGFIWIATQDGLNQYDGNRVRVFKKEPQDNRSLSNNFINCLYEDKSGAIWVGTNGGGLNRFDPKIGSFTRYPFSESYRIINDIAEDSAGNFWIATQNGGLCRFDQLSGEVFPYLDKGMPSQNVQVLYVDKSGNLYAGSAANGLFVYNNTTDRFEMAFATSAVWCITEDNQGILWVGIARGLLGLKLDKNPVTPEVTGQYTAAHFFPFAGSAVRSVYVTSGNLLVVGTTGNGIYLADLNAEKIRFVNYAHSEFVTYSLSDNHVFCLFEDRGRSIWAGTNNGLSFFDPLKQVFEHFTFQIDNPVHSLNDKNVWCIYEDAQQVLWVGTRQGLNRVDRKHNKVYRYNHKANNLNSLNNNSIQSVYIDSRGILWAGAVDGLFRVQLSSDLKTARFIPEAYRNDLTESSDNRVYQIFEDSAGYLWVASREGLGYFHPLSGDKQFYRHNPSDPNSLPANIARNIFRDHKGRMWIACDGEGIARVNVESKAGKKTLKFYPYLDALRHSDEDADLLVTSIWQEKNGLFWIGTYGSGLICFDPESGKTLRRYTERDGLPNNVIYGVLGDEAGNLWMSTNHGLSRFVLNRQKFINYLEKDGLQSNEFNIGAYFRSASGELFFGGINGFNAFYPSQLTANKVPPYVAITDVLLFNKPLSRQIIHTGDFTLGYRENNLTIKFSALHYSNPSNNRYRYMMEGLDEDFVEAGTLSEAHYNKIPHGTYKFRVYASNSDGVWSDLPAELLIRITPPFWATWWFRGLLVMLVLGGFIAFNQARVRAIKKQKRRLTEQVTQRTWEVMQQKEKIEQQKKTIEEEKNKVDKLLLNILPEETAEELKSRGKASARSYRQVTVMFTDFVGFTKIAERMRPTDLVAKLDSYFIAFDGIIQKYNLEKIKTIGDSYMCAGGVPIRSKSNPIDTVLAALEIQRYMQELREKSDASQEEEWDLRIGINTGEVIAGVIGIKRFAYDIWGNTVNTANRLQMTCEPNGINVSGSTYQEIEPYFDCLYRGKIAAKNKGEIDMYYVQRIKSELSVDGKGLEPNDKFWKYADLYLYSGINYRKAERHILRILHDKLPSNLYYHSEAHTRDVVQAAERIALLEGITDEQMFILKSAASYHDAGFVEMYDGNEPIGIRMACEALPRYGYTPAQIEEVSRLINATIIPHNPQSKLEEIICDADLDYLGRDDFHEISDKLRRELRERGKINSDRQWDEIQVKFFKQHRYFTESSIRLRLAKKKQHLQEIEQRLRENNYKD